MKLSETDILVARQSALARLESGVRRLITKGELFRVDDPIVQGREHLFAPAASKIVAAQPLTEATPEPPAAPPSAAAASTKAKTKPAAPPAEAPPAADPAADSQTT